MISASVPKSSSRYTQISEISNFDTLTDLLKNIHKAHDAVETFLIDRPLTKKEMFNKLTPAAVLYDVGASTVSMFTNRLLKADTSGIMYNHANAAVTLAATANSWGVSQTWSRGLYSLTNEFISRDFDRQVAGLKATYWEHVTNFNDAISDFPSFNGENNVQLLDRDESARQIKHKGVASGEEPHGFSEKTKIATKFHFSRDHHIRFTDEFLTEEEFTASMILNIGSTAIIGYGTRRLANLAQRKLAELRKTEHGREKKERKIAAHMKHTEEFQKCLIQHQKEDMLQKSLGNIEGKTIAEQKQILKRDINLSTDVVRQDELRKLLNTITQAEEQKHSGVQAIVANPVLVEADEIKRSSIHNNMPPNELKHANDVNQILQMLPQPSAPQLPPEQPQDPLPQRNPQANKRNREEGQAMDEEEEEVNIWDDPTAKRQKPDEPDANYFDM